MRQFGKVAFLFLNLDFAAFNPAHIQDIIDQAEQMIAGGKHLAQAVLHLAAVVNVADCNRRETDNCIHRRADIV